MDICTVFQGNGGRGASRSERGDPGGSSERASSPAEMVRELRVGLVEVDTAALGVRERIGLVAVLESSRAAHRRPRPGRPMPCASHESKGFRGMPCGRRLEVTLARRESPSLDDRSVGLSRALTERPCTMAALTEGVIGERHAVGVAERSREPHSRPPGAGPPGRSTARPPAFKWLMTRRRTIQAVHAGLQESSSAGPLHAAAAGAVQDSGEWPAKLSRQRGWLHVPLGDEGASQSPLGPPHFAHLEEAAQRPLGGLAQHPKGPSSLAVMGATTGLSTSAIGACARAGERP